MKRSSLSVSILGVLLSAIFGQSRAADPWDACCDLKIVFDDVPAGTSRSMIVDWQRQTAFTGDGFPGEMIARRTWKQQQIDSGLSTYLKQYPKALAPDYFRSLGMTCTSLDTVKETSRCEIEMPIKFECHILWMMPRGSVPLPDEVRGRFEALLRVRVDASTNELISSLSQIVAKPGGRLCTR